MLPSFALIRRVLALWVAVTAESPFNVAATMQAAVAYERMITGSVLLLIYKYVQSGA